MSLVTIFCSCQAFRQFVEDKDVLRAVAFDHLSISGHWELFQVIEGLIVRSAQAGHIEAQIILAKIILVSTSQLLSLKRDSTDKESSVVQASYDNNLSEENSCVFCFMKNFLPHQTNLLQTTGFSHFDLVRLFLSWAKLSEFGEMKPFVNDYIEYFCGSKGESFLSSFNTFAGWRSAESHLERVVLEFAKRLQDIFESSIYESKSMRFDWLKKAQLRVKEVWAEERDYCGHGKTSITTMVERIDMLMKCCRIIPEILEEEIQEVLQGCAENTELADLCHPLVLKGMREMAAVVQTHGLEFKAELSYVQGVQAEMVSKFDGLMSTCDK